MKRKRNQQKESSANENITLEWGEKRIEKLRNLESNRNKRRGKCGQKEEQEHY